MPKAADPIDRVSSRPDFHDPVLPGDHDDRGLRSPRLARSTCLADCPTKSLARNLSNETQVTPRTPPTFMFHTNEDTAVPAGKQHRVLFRTCAGGVPAELHIYEKGPHGVGLAKDIPGHEHVARSLPRMDAELADC